VSRGGGPRRIVVVGSGTRFLSGISVYTVRLANALADAGDRVGIVTMRQLLPTFLYPGRERVGRDLTDLGRRAHVPILDGIDWWWLPSLFRAAWFLARRRPGTIILEWWTGTVLHSYLALCLLARLLGAKVVIEFHEVLDTGEARIPLARLYASIVGGAVIRLASGYTVHSAFDEDLLRRHWRLRGKPVAVLPHGPHDHYRAEPGAEALPPAREAPADAVNILFFGTIRPYKGLEDLVDAFDALTEDEAGGAWLTVVGETWEGWTLPAEKIAASPRRDRMTFVNRYVHDAELDAWLRGADAAALPYRRSSLSGPLHVAMGYGLPILMTDTGGNPEAAEGYGGIVLVPPADGEALTTGLRHVLAMRGQRFAHPRSWRATAEAYGAFLDALDGAAADADARPAVVAARPDGGGGIPDQVRSAAEPQERAA
jgi:glycosyltransferase involved in cell wall biosynthesis